jgi:hypothetical protein
MTHPVTDDGCEEVAFVREVVIDKSAGDAGLAGDLFDPDIVERALREQSRADLDKLLPSCLRGKARSLLCSDADPGLLTGLKLRANCSF